MKYSFLALAFIFFVLSCVDKQGENAGEKSQEIKSEIINKNPKIEIITDFKKITKLKKQIKLEQELEERKRLDNLPLAFRLIESDTSAFDSINKLLTSKDFVEIDFFLDQFIKYKPSFFQIHNKQIKDNILNLISDTIIERKVMKAAGILDLDYEKAFVNRYKNGQEKHKAKYFYWIGKKGQNLEVLDEVFEKIKNNKITKNHQADIIFGLRQFSNSNNNEIKEKAINAAVMAFKNNIITKEEITSLKENNYKNEKAKSFLKMMLENGGAKSKSIHNICLDQDLFTINVFENLVSEKDDKAKSTLLKQLSIKEKYLKTLLAVPIVYGMEKDSTILIETLKILEKHELNNSDVTQRMNYIFSKINCRNYLKYANKYINNEGLIKELQRQYEKPEMAPKTYEDIVLELFKLHITDSIDLNTLKHVKENEVFQGTNGLIKNVLHHNSQVVTLDKWATSNPIKYDFLLNGIKNKIGKDMSNLIFKSEFNNNKYSIIMIGKDKALLVHLENNNQEIDADLLIKAVNEILDDKKLLVLKDDPDFVEIFYGSQIELNKIKGLLQPEEQGDLQI